MPHDMPPAPQVAIKQPNQPQPAPIADMRDTFARKTPQSEEDRAQAQAFISGKADMVLSDPHLSEAEKAAAIADLEQRRQGEAPTTEIPMLSVIGQKPVGWKWVDAGLSCSCL